MLRNMEFTTSRRLIAPPETPDDWRKIADDYYQIWNFPNCIGSIDRKHVVMQAPMRSGSSYFSYKGTHNIALMAACDSHYRIILVNIGESGSSDGEIFANSHFGIAFEEKTLNLPKSSFLPNTRIDFPYVLVGDEAFPLKDYLMRPYPKEVLDDAKRIFGYRLSRARRL